MNYLQLSDLTYKELEKAINKFLKIDFKVSSIAEADKLFRKIIKHFVTQTIEWKSPIYRARRNSSNKLFFENTEELIYPKRVITLGRLNEIGESIFYGASHCDTALLEMRPKLGEEFTILESRLINEDTVPKFMETGIRELMIKQNHSPDFIKQNMDMLESSLGTKDNKRRYKLINSFLIKEMTKIVKEDELYKYKGTIAIGQFYIKGNLLTDGLLYPSVNRFGAECIAIKPESYDQYYSPHRCFKVKIIDVFADGRLGCKCINNSVEIQTNGQIIWS